MNDSSAGPWFVHDFSEVDPDQTEPCVTVSCVTPDHIEVATMGRGLTGTREEMLANARLIAAAPALREVVERCLQARLITDPELLAMARHAAVKARAGGS